MVCETNLNTPTDRPPRGNGVLFVKWQYPKYRYPVPYTDVIRHGTGPPQRLNLKGKPVMVSPAPVRVWVWV